MSDRMILDGWKRERRIRSLPVMAREFFLRLVLSADDFGRCTADVKTLQSYLYPCGPDIRETDISRLLELCEHAGLVRFYVVGGERYLVVLWWHQRLTYPKAVYPEPPEGQMELDLSGVKGADPPPRIFLRRTRKRREEKSPLCSPDSPDGEVGTQAEWLDGLKKNKGYEGLNVAREFDRYAAWCSAKGRRATRARFVTWLNRCEAEVAVHSTFQGTSEKKRATDVSEEWRREKDQELVQIKASRLRMRLSGLKDAADGGRLRITDRHELEREIRWFNGTLPEDIREQAAALNLLEVKKI